MCPEIATLQLPVVDPVNVTLKLIKLSFAPPNAYALRFCTKGVTVRRVSRTAGPGVRKNSELPDDPLKTISATSMFTPGSVLQLPDADSITATCPAGTARRNGPGMHVAESPMKHGLRTS